MQLKNYQKQLERLVKTTDEIGLIQHSKGSVPDLTYGYSIDDIARGLIVLSRFYPEFNDKKIHKVYLDYIKRAERSDGFFNNFCDKDGNWKIESSENPENLEDCYGRVISALAEFAYSDYPKREREESERMFLEHSEISEILRHNCSRAVALLGLTNYFPQKPDEKIKKIILKLSGNLAESFVKNSNDSWKWFSDRMTYYNARMPNSMIRAGHVLGDNRLLKIGKESLDFFIKNSFVKKEGQVFFHAIGNREWYKKGDEKSAEYDEQPVEAGAATEAFVDGFKTLEKPNLYDFFAQRTLEWFYGNNSKNFVMLDNVSGGVYDGILEHGINMNQGAECLVCYLMAVSRIKELGEIL